MPDKVETQLKILKGWGLPAEFKSFEWNLRTKGYGLTEIDAENYMESFLICLFQNVTRKFYLDNFQDLLSAKFEQDSDQIDFQIKISKIKENFHENTKIDLNFLLNEFTSLFGEISFNPTVHFFSLDSGLKEFINGEKCDIFLTQDPSTGQLRCITQLENLYQSSEEFSDDLYTSIGTNDFLKETIQKYFSNFPANKLKNEIESFAKEMGSFENLKEFIDNFILVKLDSKILFEFQLLSDIFDKLEPEYRQTIFIELRDKLCQDSESAIKNLIALRAIEREKKFQKRLREKEDLINASKMIENDIKLKNQEISNNLNKLVINEENLKLLQLEREMNEKLLKKLGLEEIEARKKMDDLINSLNKNVDEQEILMNGVKANASQIAEVKKAISNQNVLENTLKQTMNNLEEQISQFKVEINDHEGKLLWAQFKLELNNFLPNIGIVSKRNEILDISKTSLWNFVENIFAIFQLPVGLEARSENLKKYFKNGSSNDVEELRAILHTLLKKPTLITFGDILEIKGNNFLLLSEAIEKISDKSFKIGDFQEVRFITGGTLYIDTNLRKDTWHGKNIAILADSVVICSSLYEINVSGLNGTQLNSISAPSGQYEGRDGVDGKNGDVGESGGNIYFSATRGVKAGGGKLQIYSNGGDGSNGQNGGNGADGKKGYDGRDGNPSQPTEGYILREYGDGGTSGGKGGNGGLAGFGGYGGHPGEIEIDLPPDGDFSGKISTISEKGRDGVNGRCGQGGVGGGGGRRGVDAAWYWERINAFWGLHFTGQWKLVKGEFELSPWINGYGYTTGYICKILRYENDAKRNAQMASNGLNGHVGLSVEQRISKGEKSSQASKKHALTNKEILNKSYNLLIKTNSEQENILLGSIASGQGKSTEMAGKLSQVQSKNQELRKNAQSMLNKNLELNQKMTLITGAGEEKNIIEGSLEKGKMEKESIQQRNVEMKEQISIKNSEFVEMTEQIKQANMDLKMIAENNLQEMNNLNNIDEMYLRNVFNTVKMTKSVNQMMQRITVLDEDTLKISKSKYPHKIDGKFIDELPKDVQDSKSVEFENISKLPLVSLWKIIVQKLGKINSTRTLSKIIESTFYKMEIFSEFDLKTFPESVSRLLLEIVNEDENIGSIEMYENYFRHDFVVQLSMHILYGGWFNSAEEFKNEMYKLFNIKNDANVKIDLFDIFLRIEKLSIDQRLLSKMKFLVHYFSQKKIKKETNDEKAHILIHIQKILNRKIREYFVKKIEKIAIGKDHGEIPSIFRSFNNILTESCVEEIVENCVHLKNGSFDVYSAMYKLLKNPKFRISKNQFWDRFIMSTMNLIDLSSELISTKRSAHYLENLIIGLTLKKMSNLKKGIFLLPFLDLTSKEINNLINSTLQKSKSIKVVKFSDEEQLINAFVEELVGKYLNNLNDINFEIIKKLGKEKESIEIFQKFFKIIQDLVLVQMKYFEEIEQVLVQLLVQTDQLNLNKFYNEMENAEILFWKLPPIKSIGSKFRSICSPIYDESLKMDFLGLVEKTCIGIENFNDICISERPMFSFFSKNPFKDNPEFNNVDLFFSECLKVIWVNLESNEITPINLVQVTLILKKVFSSTNSNYLTNSNETMLKLQFHFNSKISHYFVQGSTTLKNEIIHKNETIENKIETLSNQLNTRIENSDEIIHKKKTIDYLMVKIEQIVIFSKDDQVILDEISRKIDQMKGKIGKEFINEVEKLLEHFVNWNKVKFSSIWDNLYEIFDQNNESSLNFFLENTMPKVDFKLEEDGNEKNLESKYSDLIEKKPEATTFEFQQNFQKVLEILTWYTDGDFGNLRQYFQTSRNEIFDLNLSNFMSNVNLVEENIGHLVTFQNNIKIENFENISKFIEEGYILISSSKFEDLKENIDKYFISCLNKIIKDHILCSTSQNFPQHQEEILEILINNISKESNEEIQLKYLISIKFLLLNLEMKYLSLEILVKIGQNLFQSKIYTQISTEQREELKEIIIWQIKSNILKDSENIPETKLSSFEKYFDHVCLVLKYIDLDMVKYDLQMKIFQSFVEILYKDESKENIYEFDQDFQQALEKNVKEYLDSNYPTKSLQEIHQEHLQDKDCPLKKIIAMTLWTSYEKLNLFEKDHFERILMYGECESFNENSKNRIKSFISRLKSSEENILEENRLISSGNEFSCEIFCFTGNEMIILDCLTNILNQSDNNTEMSNTFSNLNQLLLKNSSTKWDSIMKEFCKDFIFRQFLIICQIPSKIFQTKFNELDKEFKIMIIKFLSTLNRIDDESDIFLKLDQNNKFFDNIDGEKIKRVFQEIVEFKNVFNQNLFFFEENYQEDGFEIWLSLIQWILKSVRHNIGQNSLFEVSKVFSAIENLNIDVTVNIFENFQFKDWLKLIFIEKIIQSYKKISEKSNQFEEFDFIPLNYIESYQVLEILAEKIEQESELISEKTLIDSKKLKIIFKMLEENLIYSQENLESLSQSSISQWKIILKNIKFSQKWGANLVPKIIKMEKLYGEKLTSNFLLLFRGRSEENILLIFEKLYKGTWNLDEEILKKLNQDGNVKNFESLFTEHMKNKQSRIRDINELLRISMENRYNKNFIHLLNPEMSAKIQKIMTFQSTQMVSTICPELVKISDWSSENILAWTKRISHVPLTERKSFVFENLIEILTVSCQAVFLNSFNPPATQFIPRATQLMAVLIFLDSFFVSGKGRLGQIFTGEGKTIIIGILSVVFALSGTDIDIITSSPVLASENALEMKKFYGLFGLDVGSNCDKNIENDENLKKELYQQCRIIYGDVSSFQRDYLLTKYFDKGLLMGRKPGSIIVDEVDSLLLDKGENILYLSHSIPELQNLRMVFIEIWQAIHARDSNTGTEDDIAKVSKFIRTRMSRREVIVPNCLLDFVEARINTWVKNAYLAERIQENDPYIVGDPDRNGQKIVIMDKNTGVEQINMTWSNGLQQFLQLKHSDKISPESLKAIFISNYSYFRRFLGSIYGLTGTLGSDPELSLLKKCYQVDAFSLPHFKSKLLHYEDDILVKSEKSWLTSIRESCEKIVKDGRAGLIICENIENLERIEHCLKGLEGSSVYSYKSSFDKKFGERIRTQRMAPGDFVVATNLAGRGTDFKLGKNLDASGGLQVILTYLPSNLRVEDQAFGRCARSGNKGSIQFILQIPENFQEHDAIDIEKLKSIRDEHEFKRLEEIRTNSLQRIELEEKFFKKFGKFFIVTKNWLKENFAENFVTLQLDFLKNRWAIWLDGMGEKLTKFKFYGEVKLDEEFEEFLNELKTHFNKTKEEKIFAKFPTELLKLSIYFEEKNEYEKALGLFNEIILKEPDFCEAAHYYQVSCLFKNDSFGKTVKKRAIYQLKSAERILIDRINTASSSFQVLEFLDKTRRKGGKCTNVSNYKKQIDSEIQILHTHIGGLREGVGKKITPKDFTEGGLKGFVKIEEAEELFELFRKSQKIMANFRFSKKVEIKNGEIYLNQIYGSNKINKKIHIVWSPLMKFCKINLISLINEKLNSFQNRVVEKKELEAFTMTRAKFWNILKENNFISQEKIEKLSLISFVPDAFEEFPDKLKNFRDTIKAILESKNDKKFQKDMFAKCELKENDINILVEYLKLKKVIRETEIKSATINKDLVKITDEGMLELPETLNKFMYFFENTLIEENTQEIKPHLNEQDLKILCETETEGANQIWNYLLEKNLIKECKVKFTLEDSLDSSLIEQRKNEIKNGLQDLKIPLEKIFDKYHQDLYEEKLETGITNIYNLAISGEFRAASEMFAEGSLKVNDQLAKFSPMHKIIKEAVVTPILSLNNENDGKNLEIISMDAKKDMKAYLRREAFKKYEEQIYSFLEDTIGRIKIFPEIKTGLNPLREYFYHGQHFPSDELEEFHDLGFDQVLSFSERKSWWDWGAFTVAMIGLAQIALGIVLEIFTLGAGTYLAAGLIGEGIGDIMFAIDAGLNKNFSWKSYGNYKAISVAISLVTGGIGAYLSRGVQVARYGATIGYALLRAVGYRFLKKAGQAVAFALSNFAIDKILDQFRIMLLQAFSTQIGKIFEITDEHLGNKSISRIEKQIEEIFKYNSFQDGKIKIEKIFQSVIYSQDGRGLGQLHSHSQRFTGEISSELGRSSKKLFSHGSRLAENKNLGSSASVLNKAAQIKKYVGYISKIIKASRITKGLIDLKESSFGIMNDIATELEKEAAKKGPISENSIKASQDEVNRFKSEIIENTKKTIVNNILSTIQHSFLQPVLQASANRSLVRAGKYTIKVTGSFVNSVKIRPHQGEVSKKLDINSSSIDINTRVENAGGIPVKNLIDVYGDNLQFYQNSKGLLHVKRPTFEQFTRSMGKGKMAGFLEIMICANYLNRPIIIQDPNNEIVPITQGNSLKINPNNKKNLDKPAITLIFEKNGDLGHFSAVIGGKVIEGSVEGVPTNSCLYESLARVLNGDKTQGQIGQKKVEFWRNNIENYANSSKTTKILFKSQVQELASDFSGGAKRQRQRPGPYQRPNPPTPQDQENKFKKKHILDLSDHSLKKYKVKRNDGTRVLAVKKEEVAILHMTQMGSTLANSRAVNTFMPTTNPDRPMNYLRNIQNLPETFSHNPQNRDPSYRTDRSITIFNAHRNNIIANPQLPAFTYLNDKRALDFAIKYDPITLDPRIVHMGGPNDYFLKYPAILPQPAASTSAVPSTSTSHHNIIPSSPPTTLPQNYNQDYLEFSDFSDWTRHSSLPP